MLRMLSVIAGFGLLIVLPGCSSKVHAEKSGMVDAKNAMMYIVDGPKQNQRVKVEAVAQDAEVNLFVVLEKDFTSDLEATLDSATDKTKLPATVLAKQFNSKNISQEVNIPAKESFRVMVATRKATPCVVKVNSQ